MNINSEEVYMAAVGGGGGVPNPYQALSAAFEYSTEEYQLGTALENLQLRSYDERNERGQLATQVQDLFNAINRVNQEHPEGNAVLNKLLGRMSMENPEIYDRIAAQFKRQSEEKSKGEGLNL